MEIKVKCNYDELMPLDALPSLQGGLKKIDKDRYTKVLNSIVKNGIIYPLYVWDSEHEKTYLLDGVHRLRAITELRRRGHQVAGVPVVFIKAASKEEAKKLILLASSQYAKVDKKGMVDFLGNIDWKAWSDEVSLNVFDKLAKQDQEKIKEVRAAAGNQRTSDQEPREEKTTFGWSVLFQRGEEKEFLDLMSAYREKTGQADSTEIVVLKVLKKLYDKI